MAATVLFHRLASDEYRAAQRRYARRGIAVEQRFLDAIDAAIDRIAAAPERWPTYRQHHRWVRVGRFPYAVFYQIVDPETVLVLAIAHGRRRPGYWAGRSRP